MKRTLPDLSFEKKLWQKGFIVVGVDEVGRGALAGPVLVGAVCLDKRNSLEGYGINDSKKVSPRKREKLAKIIKKGALAYATAASSATKINRLGIVAATQMAIRRAVRIVRKKTNYRPIYVLIDAFYVKYIQGVGLKKQKAIVHGDALSLSIAASSIVAKVERDNLMKRLHIRYRYYHWSKNKGYGTKDHVGAILKYGKTRQHRDLYLRKILK